MTIRRYNPKPDSYKLTTREIALMYQRKRTEMLYDEGFNRDEIARKLGVSEPQVRKWIRHSIDQKKDTKEQLRLRAIEMYADLLKKEGATEALRQVAEISGVAPKTVLKWTKGVRPDLRKQEKNRAKVIKLYNKYKSVVKVAKATGIPRRLVAEWIEHLQPTKEEWERKRLQALEMFKVLRSFRAVGKKVGVSPKTVRGWVEKHYPWLLDDTQAPPAPEQRYRRNEGEEGSCPDCGGRIL